MIWKGGVVYEKQKYANQSIKSEKSESPVSRAIEILFNIAREYEETIERLQLVFAPALRPREPEPCETKSDQTAVSGLTNELNMIAKRLQVQLRELSQMIDRCEL